MNKKVYVFVFNAVKEKLKICKLKSQKVKSIFRKRK